MSKKPKIAVYAISKNEGLHVRRFCESAKDADLILIADTGSTDDTVDLARECGADVHEISISPWRFDRARNEALALLPDDIDVCISLDLDEVLEPGWREEIERVWVGGANRLEYQFDWGNGLIFNYQKIHGRHSHFWHHPVHEVPRPHEPEKEVWARTDKLLVSHHPDPTKSRGQYLDLLKLAVEEDPDDPHESFYLSREFYFWRQWDDAIAEATRYLSLPRATWQNERCYALRVVARCFAEKGDWIAAEANYLKAAAESPWTREPWFELAAFYYRASMWPASYAAATRTLSIERRPGLYTENPEAWSAQAEDYAAIAAWNLGLKDQALRYAKDALEKSPDDQRLRDNLRLIERS